LTKFAIAWTGTLTALLPFFQQWAPLESVNGFQPVGHFVLYLSSQYCMKALPELEYTNCCQPRQVDGLPAPLQAEVMKKLELSWSENSLTPFGSVTLVTPVTLSKDPMASDMWPVTWAETSVPLPIWSGRRPPLAGGYGRAGAVVHGTSCHSVLGYEDVKHPFLGAGTRAIPLRQSCRVFADGACVAAGGGLGFCVCARPSGAVNNAVNTARPSAIIARRDPGLFHEFVFNGLVVTGDRRSRSHRGGTTVGLRGLWWNFRIVAYPLGGLRPFVVYFTAITRMIAPEPGSRCNGAISERASNGHRMICPRTDDRRFIA
jgi:hypothetical protein